MDEFQIPEDVTQVEDLEAAVDAALKEATEIGKRDDLTDEELNRLDVLASFVEAATAEAQAREDAAAERDAKVEATKRRLGLIEDETPEDSSAEGEEQPEGEGEQESDEEQEQPDAVAAAGVRRKRAPSLIRRTRQPDNPTPGSGDVPWTITAAAGTHVEMGSKLSSVEDVAKAYVQRSRTFPKGTPNVYLRESVATFSRGGWGDLDQEKRSVYQDDQELLDAAGNERRLVAAGQARPGQAGLIAAGGWCAPSEVLYDIPGMESTDGLLDIPEIPVRRGGINTTLGPDFKSIFTNAGFVQTEAQAIAGDTKACTTIDCPDFDEVRLDAVGVCVKAPLLTNSAYPELVRRVIAGTMVAHQHKIAARTLATISSLIGSAATTPATNSFSWGFLTAVELAAEGKRQDYRLSENETLELVVPRWARVALRADFAAKQELGIERVTDDVIVQHFADRKVRIQFVLNFGQLDTTPGCVTDLPDTVTVLMYPAGTFVRGVQDVISLDTVYDSTDLSTNVYTAVFAEEGMLVAQRGYGACKLTIPVNVLGASGPLSLTRYGV